MCIDELNRFSSSEELQTLERRLKGFNVFEEIGVQRKELFHSRMLRFLLDAKESHKLGEKFLKAFLRKFLPDKDEVLGVDLNDAVAHRELGRIDILVAAGATPGRAAQVVVAIENKIDSGEHGKQLVMYRKWVHANYRDTARKIFVFLTPEGDLASDSEHWRSVSYTAVAECVKEIIEEIPNDAKPRVRESLEQYLDVLRRHIVPNSEISDQCLAIYGAHKRALDLIFEHIPDQRMEIKRGVEEFITGLGDPYALDSSTKKYIRFAYTPWDQYYPVLQGNGRGWVGTTRIVLFEFTNSPDGLALHLVIGPATPEAGDAHEYRNRVFQVFKEGDITGQYKSVASVTLLNKGDYENPPEDLLETLNERLATAFASDGFVELTIRMVMNGLPAGAGGGGA